MPSILTRGLLTAITLVFTCFLSLELYSQYTDTVFTNTNGRDELSSAFKNKDGDIIAISTPVTGSFPARTYSYTYVYVFSQDLQLKRIKQLDLLGSKYFSEPYKFLEEVDDGYIFCGLLSDSVSKHGAPYMFKLDRNLEVSWIKYYQHPDYSGSDSSTYKVDFFLAGIKLDSAYLILSYCYPCSSNLPVHFRETDLQGNIVRDTSFSENLGNLLGGPPDLAFATKDQIIFRADFVTYRFDKQTLKYIGAENKDYAYHPKGKVLYLNFNNRNHYFAAGAGIKQTSAGVSDTSFFDPISGQFRGNDMFLFRFDTNFTTTADSYARKYIRTTDMEQFDDEFDMASFAVTTDNNLFFAASVYQQTSSGNSGYNRIRFEPSDSYMYLHKTDLLLTVQCSTALFKDDDYNHYPRFVIATDDGGAIVFTTRMFIYNIPHPLNLYAFKVGNDCQILGIADISSLSKINVYPNPVKNDLVIEVPDVFGKLKGIVMYDFTGKIIQNIIPDGFQSTYSINTESLPNGIYNLMITGQTGCYPAKFVVSH